MKKTFLIILSSLFLLSCGSKAITSDDFYQVDVGMSSKEVKEKMGTPYSVKNLGNGEVQYKYIERVRAGDRVLLEKHYLITIKDGKVTSKKVIDLNRPVYERNSYDMQTSLSEELPKD
ncbi:MAG: outer membrane protein assembly factor BamE [Parachlamydiales bacterium]|nr:outer membrane protein assembly factor BamE [Parachlamydiales bacterium]